MEISRRNFLTETMLAATGISIGAETVIRNRDTPVGSPGPMSINVFSKVFQWLGWKDMAIAAAAAGFDGIDLTVRPDGHVLPENVATDLPKAVDAIRKAGLDVHMICTAINRADDPLTEPVLKSASSLGISQYRLGWIGYDDKIGIDENLKSIEKTLSGLAAMNKHYKIKGSYQNHSGVRFGAPLWDLAKLLQEIGSPWLGCQYDIRHAIVEGAYSWPLAFKLLRPYINSIDIKDFIWADNNGKWETLNVPLGKGMVDFKTYFNLLKEANIRVPISLHYEYDLGGAEHGDKKITAPKDEVLRSIRDDLSVLKKLLNEAGVRQH